MHACVYWCDPRTNIMCTFSFLLASGTCRPSLTLWFYSWQYEVKGDSFWLRNMLAHCYTLLFFSALFSLALLALPSSPPKSEVGTRMTQQCNCTVVWPFKSAVVTECTICRNKQKLCILLVECIYVLHGSYNKQQTALTGWTYWWRCGVLAVRQGLQFMYCLHHAQTVVSWYAGVYTGRWGIRASALDGSAVLICFQGDVIFLASFMSLSDQICYE